jgi:hypothetical protein
LQNDSPLRLRPPPALWIHWAWKPVPPAKLAIPGTIPPRARAEKKK